MRGVSIRPGKASDFDEIFRLLEQLWAYKKLNRKLLRKAFLASLKDKNYRAFLAVDGPRVLGFAGTNIHNFLWQAGKACRLNELVVDKSARGLGAGSILLKHVEKYARKKKCRGVDLETAKRRRRTYQFYKARGYNPGAIFFIKLFYPDR